MLVGYARAAPTVPPGALAAQRAQLLAAGCGRIFVDVAAGRDAHVQLEEAIRFAREGDTVVCSRPEIAANSCGQLHALLLRLQGRRVALSILSMGELDVRQQAAVVGALAGLVHAARRERLAVGIAEARARGAYKGGKVKYSRAIIADMSAAGVQGKQIAKVLGCHPETVWESGAYNPPPKPPKPTRRVRTSFPPRYADGRFIPKAERPVGRYE